MSYPPGPGDPYGRQPPQQPYGYPQQPPAQPGHGYPTQPQPQAQPPYGYPQQPQSHAPFAAYPGGPEVMPSSARTARAMLFVLGGLQILGGLLLLLGAAALKSVDDTDELTMPIGLVYVMGVLFLAFAVLSIGMGAKYRTGGNGTRIGSIVIGVLVALSSVATMISGAFLLLAPLALSVLLIVFAAKAETAAWFKRPQY
ncbi:hypothetical protein PV341_36185 [Streptomyces sp. PA03-1a]|nr:hypothetical protein [Streptomyces sp. PA03-1a]MDX2819212.1 hypothetical protein [Streptomyces sp. PA03-5A]